MLSLSLSSFRPGGSKGKKVGGSILCLSQSEIYKFGNKFSKDKGIKTILELNINYLQVALEIVTRSLAFQPMESFLKLSKSDVVLLEFMEK